MIDITGRKITRRQRSLMALPGNIMGLVFMAFMAKAMLGPGLVSAPAARDFAAPALTGRVVDGAGVLAPATVATLETISADLENATQAQLVVATIPDLGGRTIEDYGYRLGRAWGIGRKDIDDGVILLLAPGTREVRIEVGYGLEGTLTDALSRSIIEREMVPAFREGNLDAGILAGAGRIASIVRTADTAAPRSRPVTDARASAHTSAHARPAQGWNGAPGLLAMAFMGVFALFPLLGLIEALRCLISPAYGAQRVAAPGGRSSGWHNGGGGGGFSGRSGGFSGGGGSFGGGGASGRW